jgi:drug/metabolite transporter (DMT)-like permease
VNERAARPEGAAAGRARAALFVGVAGSAFATSGPLASWARPAHPLAVACGRTALAALVLVAVDPIGLVRAFRATPPRVRAGILGAGALLAGHFTLFVWSLDHTSLPAAISLVSLEPLSVVLWSFALHGLRPTRLEQLGVLAATAGAMLVGRGAGVGEHHLSGDLLMLGAVALYGLYVSAARSFRGHLSATHYVALVYASAAACCGATLLVAGRGDLGPLPSHALMAIAALALVPTLVGHTMVQAAARVTSPSLVALASPVETVGGLAIAAAFLHATPSSVELCGAAIIVAGATAAILGRS